MRVANVDGRLAMVVGDRFIDVAEHGWASSDAQSVYEHWTEFREWAERVGPTDAPALAVDRLGPVVPRPRQILAIGLNYGGHAAETGLDAPDSPMVFTKFASSLA